MEMVRKDIRVLSPEEIEVGKWYRAKDKRRTPRYVLYVSPDRGDVQFDGMEVRLGQHYPHRSMDTFLRWCGGRAEVDSDGYPVKNGWGVE
jgi:hypothetical protein